ncbi:hypothetical protein [Peredibacter starrii]|uniref:Uncharacterized protein n=1 Tax=Peredibacter starrii TaxID=28202 RepID=A0AAX4HPY9_9BACT|nr:hypothetical protein [Peredibacter starrii]WPU65306.1 hypothetical protein SOO65_00930 [Peredibacter starrii]
MSKSSFVLRALKILGLEEMLKLSEVLHVKQVPLKKAAGEELIVWDDEPVQKPVHRTVSAPTPGPQTEARVLNFPKKTITDLAPQVEEDKPEDAKTEESTFLSSEIVLWQREIARSTDTAVHKLDAFKGYNKATEMYVVKTPSVDGKDKIRFAETNGVLINKKQA